jgi:hypothetical protein
MFCMDLRINVTIRPYWIDTVLYNRDGVCLLRGTNWIFKYSSVQSTSENGLRSIANSQQEAALQLGGGGGVGEELTTATCKKSYEILHKDSNQEKFYATTYVTQNVHESGTPNVWSLHRLSTWKNLSRNWHSVKENLVGTQVRWDKPADDYRPTLCNRIWNEIIIN